MTISKTFGIFWLQQVIMLNNQFKKIIFLNSSIPSYQDIDKIQASFGEKDTEKHDFQEVFDHYREVFFVLLDLAINESEARWLFCAYLLMLLWILILHKQESLLGVGEHFKIDFNPLVPDVH